MEGASHRHDRIEHHGHHWIEEGTFEDFRRNILDSDLPEVSFALVGTVTHRHYGSNGADFLLGYRGDAFMEQGVVDPHVLDNPPPVFALMGTVVPPVPGDPMWRAAQGAVYVHQTDLRSVDKKVLDMLLARPEVVGHEPKRAAVPA